MNTIEPKIVEPETKTATNVDTAMDINVLYFASLADEAGRQQEIVSVVQSTSLSELYDQLRQKHGFSRPQAELRVAVNDYFAKWTEQIHDGDSVVFITPVAGG
ncbi:MoaD/ThiS family protein [Psychrobacter sp. 1U1]|uniref:MoaD/ThiS family protein n=1 Tax=Psychrobacter sp. 1U1 TaxID=3453576 RepID=UPI003F4613DD